MDALKTGECDIGILYHTGEADKSLELKVLMPVRMALVGYAGEDAECHDFITPNQVIHTELFINEPNCVFRGVFENYLRARNIVLDSVTEMGSIEAIRRGIANNLGISYLPYFVVEEQLADGLFQEFPMEDTGQEIYIAYAIHKNKWKGKALELFLQMVDRELNG